MPELIPQLIDLWRRGAFHQVAEVATLLDRPSLVLLTLELLKVSPQAPRDLAFLMQEMQTLP